MGLFSKVEDYNLILEKVLESKYFSSNTKSLLLSMIYKIESFYDDYKQVKHISKTKDEFLTEIIEIIKKYCDNIKLVEPDSKDAEIIKQNNVLALTNERERSILSYPTEIALLYAISDVLPKYFYIPDDFSFKGSFQRLLVNGYNLNNVEILSDFNGWSWDINLKYKNNIEDNLIYQNLMILFGNKFMDKWLEETSIKINSLNEIKSRLSKTKCFEILCKYLYFISNEKEKLKINKLFREKQEELDKISDKVKYFDDIKLKKLRYLKKLEKIDKLLNDKELLRKEYIDKNLKLDEKNRMATVSVYRKKVEARRKECIDNISELTKIANPVNFMKYKNELQDFVNSFDISEGKEKIILDFQKEFIKVLYDISLNLEKENEIIDFIYKIRYYKNIYFDDKKQIKDIKILNKKLDEVLKVVITKACKKSIIKIISLNVNINFEIISKMLDTKIMNLEEIRFEVRNEENKVKIMMYEKEVYEKDFILDYDYKNAEIGVKGKRLIKLF